jgi:NAD(P)-dependent dehydrogenase (short-subunit alcohol dehydrogenase family)
MNGRVAAVLGVGPGLGAAVARRFAVEGFAVAMMARREESLAQIRQDIEGGGTALPVSADATDADSVAAAFERIRTELGDPRSPSLQRRRVPDGRCSRDFARAVRRVLQGKLRRSV